ncbi:hypothetical protein [Petrimonas sp.]|uniref:hypothetical protein n=1 Tax=Petrimonas sp. TaxID=2023866 RepID=UPI003F5132B1
MGMFFFYNNKKPRKFSHTPILYDPDKEERREQMEKRIRRMREEVAREEGREIETPQEAPKTDFGAEFLSQTKYLKRRKEREEDNKRPFFTSNLTVFLLIIALLIIFYFVILR